MVVRISIDQKLLYSAILIRNHLSVTSEISFSFYTRNIKEASLRMTIQESLIKDYYRLLE